VLTTVEEIDSQVIPAPLAPESLASAGDQAAVITDGAFFSLMVGLGETYLPAFALALGASHIPAGLEIATGLLVAIPIFLGAIIQLVTPFAVRQLASHRRWVVVTVGCQACSLLLLPLVVMLDRWSFPMLFVVATLYWASGLSCGPPWNTWMEDVIPKKTRTHFFAKRVRICQFATMLGFVIGGLLLEYGKRGDWLMSAFIAVFITASISRFVSTGLLASTTEPLSAQTFARTHIGLNEIRRKVSGHAGMRMLWFLFAMQASVQISGPYFTPFMLRKLQLGYQEFMWLVVLGYLGKVVALRAWGKLANRTSARNLLWIGSVTIVPLSGAWVALRWIEEPFLYLCLIQFAGGIAWAAYELGFFLMFFEAIPRRERTSLLTIYNFGNSVSLLVGAILGAAWLGWHREAQSAYLALFVISSVARLLSLVLLRRISK
jgi:MFS family permease